MGNTRRYLEDRELIRLRGDSRGVLLRGVEGTLWVTQEGDACDHLLRTGDTLTVDRVGLVLVQALGGACVEVVDPEEAGVLARLRRGKPAEAPSCA